MNLNNILFSNDAVLVAQTTTSHQRRFLAKPFKAQIPVASGIAQSQLTVT